eukprot:m.20129 g.20129  ORF g.20129 m.20129 type:complete len:556 (+) comp3504_c0_seq1:1194-2861(+)
MGCNRSDVRSARHALRLIRHHSRRRSLDNLDRGLDHRLGWGGTPLGRAVLHVHGRKLVEHLIDADGKLGVLLDLLHTRLERRVLVDVDRAAELLILLKILQESLVVMLAGLLLALGDDLLLLRQVLQLPCALAVALALVAIALLDQDDVRQGRAVELVGVLIVPVRAGDVIPKDIVAGLQKVAEMGADGERGVVDTQILRASDCDLHKGILLVGDRAARVIADRLDVEDRQLDQLRGRCDRAKRIRPVWAAVDLSDLKSVGVDEMQAGANTNAHNKLAHAAVGAGQVCGQTNEVVLADRDDLNGKRVLEVEGVAVNVVRDEALRSLHTHGGDGRQELREVLCIAAVVEVEVNAIRHRLDADGLRVLVVLDDQLLQVQERLLVADLLAGLHDGVPRVLGLAAVARVAHLVRDDVLDHKDLLQHGAGEDLLLNGQLDLQALRVGLGPDEPGIDETDLVEALETLEAEGEKLARLELALHPRARRVEVAAASAAVVDRHLLRDALADVDLGADAVDAHCGRVRRDLQTALAAQDHVLLSPRGRGGERKAVGHYARASD